MPSSSNVVRNESEAAGFVKSELEPVHTRSFTHDLRYHPAYRPDVDGLRALAIIPENVEFVKGLFQETLPINRIPRIAVLHIDGDWYESVKVCLESLYDKVVPNGVIQLDDYGYWKGAREAVDEFFEPRGIHVPLKRLDYSGRFLIKSGPITTAAAER